MDYSKELFARLKERIAYAEEVHPEGPTILALMSEIGELSDCLVDDESPQRIIEEAIDVATVAMRIAGYYLLILDLKCPVCDSKNVTQTEIYKRFIKRLDGKRKDIDGSTYLCRDCSFEGDFLGLCDKTISDTPS